MSQPAEINPLTNIAVVLIKPENYVHSAALAELTETVLHGLAAPGLNFQLFINEFPVGYTCIILGAHLLDAVSMKAVPANSIIYNSEQIDEKSSWINSAYLTLLKENIVWDYSQENIRRLQFLGIKRAVYVAVGYVPQLTRIPRVVEDIDVLFYGSINERRRLIVDALIQRGVKVQVLSDVYREERDHYIARAKIVLNMHFYDASVFEVVRVSYLLANEKLVVAECGSNTTIDDDLRDAVFSVPYEHLVDACVNLLANPQARAAQARRGLEIFRQRDEIRILAQALGVALSASSDALLPTALNLGSGKDWRESCLNVDINEDFRPDAILDIGKQIQEGQILSTRRFGEVKLKDNMFDAILANDVLEHIPNLICAMKSCLRLLKPGGHFLIQVPYDLSLGAWQDPTHIRAFNENSWLYYTDWYWYLGWLEAKFDLIDLEFRLSALGESLQQAGNPFEDILRTPRAVDGMNVKLRKRYLQESEVQAPQMGIDRPWDTTAFADQVASLSGHPQEKAKSSLCDEDVLLRGESEEKSSLAPHASERNGVVGKSPIHIGRFTYGLEHLAIREWGEGAALNIGSFCSISSSVTIFLGGNHRMDWVTTFPFGHIFQEELAGEGVSGHPATNGDVIIGNDVWIGHGVTIMSGVTIGDGAVIAANAHVVKNVMPYEVVGGNPAKKIKNRFTAEIISLLSMLAWWEFPIEEIKRISKQLSTEPSSESLNILLKQYR